MWFVVLVLFIMYIIIKKNKINAENPYYQYKKEQDKMVNDFVHVNKILMETVNKTEVLAKVQNLVAEEFNRPDIKIPLDDLESKIKSFNFENVQELLDALPAKVLALVWCYLTNEINMFLEIAKITKHDFYQLNIDNNTKESLKRVQNQMKFMYQQRKDYLKIISTDIILEHLNLAGIDDAWYELWSCLYPGYEYYQNNEKEFENLDSNLDFTDINLFPDLDSYDY